VGGDIHYGIKTGYNTAFVIDGATRERLCQQDPNSQRMIKPWLRGRDVKRWHVESHEIYFIKSSIPILIDTASLLWISKASMAATLFAPCRPMISTC
jgi:adenine-specific DNA-methyltransferase